MSRNLKLPEGFTVGCKHYHPEMDEKDMPAYVKNVFRLGLANYVTEGWVKDSNGKVVSTEYSFCSPSDNPVKAIGRQKSTGRAKSNAFRVLGML